MTPMSDLFATTKLLHFIATGELLQSKTCQMFIIFFFADCKKLACF